MSVQNGSAAAGEGVVQERPAAGGIYASLFEKINLTPVAALSALDTWQDAQAMSEATADERLTAGMQVFLECLTRAGSKVEKLDKHLIDHHIAELDWQISRQLDAVMHHEAFQATESLWRGVKSLVDKTDFRQNVKIELLDMSKEDLRQDFEDSPEIIQSGLYKHTYIDEYDTPGGEPVAALISAYEFDASAQDVALLRSISKVSAAAHMPFIGSAGPKFFLKESMEEVAASQLYHAEQKLTRLGEVLQRLELKHLSQLDTLRTLLHNSAVRLENSDDTTCSGLKNQSGIVSPASVTNAAAASTRELTDGSPEDIQTPGGTVKWVYVAQPEPQPNVDVLATVPTPVKQWKSFTAGMCTMLLISAAALWSWHLIQRPSPLRVQLAASLAPLPAVLAPDKLAQLRQQSPLPEELLTQTQQQLARLDELPADWNIDYSRMLIEQARVLWPEQATSMALHWQQQLNAAALPTDRLNGWHEGMTALQKLSDRLNGLDEKKGKYMTVSELKSVVFSSMQSFNRSIPAEEQLRVLFANPAGLPLPVTARVQLEMHLKQLIARYAAIKQTAKE